MACILGNLFERGESLDIFWFKPRASLHSHPIHILVPFEIRGSTCWVAQIPATWINMLYREPTSTSRKLIVWPKPVLVSSFNAFENILNPSSFHHVMLRPYAITYTTWCMTWLTKSWIGSSCREKTLWFLLMHSLNWAKVIEDCWLRSACQAEFRFIDQI